MKLAYATLVRLPTGRAHGYAIMKMCEQFAAHGSDVALYVPTRRHGIKDDPFTYYGIMRNFSLHKLWATDFLGTKERSRVAFALDQLSFLFSVLLKNFHGQTLYTRDYQVALFARARRIVLEVHNIPKRSFLFFRAVSRSAKIIVISNGLKSTLIERGVPAEKIAVAPDAVDLSEFNGIPSREIWKRYGVDPLKKEIVLYTGHFYGWKGAETLAEAAEYLPHNVEVVLMGGIDQELAHFQKKYVGSRVHVIGFQPREQIPGLLMSSDVLVLPNSAKPKISSHYTSPLKLFQYMASGVPIVASDLPSIREILTDEMVFWFTPDDARSLAQQITSALERKEESRRKAALARENVKKYTWDARTAAILAHINS